ncbi:MAG TPA: hypothetical protein VIG66_11535 [Noviherbaspirillum sp.]
MPAGHGGPPKGAATRHGRCHGKEPQRRTVGKPSGIGELVRANPLYWFTFFVYRKPHALFA